MRILYGIQGTGNGHISRAMEILPALQQHGDVDVLISGMQSELNLPVDVNYQIQGLGFVFGKKGGIDLVETYKKSRLKQFYKEVKSMPVEDYDLVISDFEPITAWASLQKGRQCIGLSNQASLLSPAVPLAKSDDFVGKFIIRNYAPCSINFGFSYKAYDQHIFTPIIRQSIRERDTSNKGHFTVYLPAYSDEKIISILSEVKNGDFEVFSKKSKEAYTTGNIVVQPLQKDAFEESLLSCAGVITAAGFGTTTEALFLGKKLLVIPQKHQYEQACNAHALQHEGVSVIKSLKTKHIDKIRAWIDYGEAVKMNYQDTTSALIDELIYSYHSVADPYTQYLERDQYTLKSA
jgi:uncharacterized protein (TIGR00661 family)